MSDAPNIWHIERRDLTDPDRLGALYVEAVRAGLWPNSNRWMLEFAALAEKACSDDSAGTPERLFAGLLRRENSGRFVTNAAEQQAEHRFPGWRRNELVDQARVPAKRPRSQRDLFDASGLEHLGFSHAVLMQCFLPQARRPGREWVQRHGRTSLVVRAGYKPDPDLLGGILPAGLPWGSRARLVLHYVTSEAIKSQSPEVDMGRSLRNFLTRIGAPIGGKNAKIVAEAVYDVAGAEIVLGGFDGRRATVRGSKVAKEVSFWIERGHTIQEAFWRPAMTLSHDFFEAINERPVPLNAEHLAALARSPRRMDLYLWLTYRTAAIRRGASVGIRLDDLRSIFAPDVAPSNVRHFRAAIKRDLAAVCGVHPFRVDLNGNLLELRRTPPPIPEKASLILGTATRRK